MAWNIGERVGILRHAKGWTRAELARRTKLNQTHLWKIEQGQRARVEAETVRRLARAFGCTTDYLLGMDAPDEEADPARLVVGLSRLRGRGGKTWEDLPAATPGGACVYAEPFLTGPLGCVPRTV